MAILDVARANLIERLTLVLVLVLTVGCGEADSDEPIMVDEDDVDDVVLDEGEVSLVDAQFMVGSNGEYYANMAHLQGRQLGDMRLHFASNMVLENEGSKAETATVHVVLQGYSEIASQNVEVPANSTVEVPPLNPTIDYDQLYSVTTPVSANIQVEVHVGDSLVDLRSESVEIQPLNRFRWFWESNGEYLDMRPFIGVLITPEDRENEIQSLLTDAAQYTQNGSIHGYQGNSEEDALEQAAAIYYALQARGMVYTDVSGSFFDGAQNVKSPAQSLRTGSANCIDGMLVFASAYEAMGMNPILIFVSGHAFVGIRLGPEDDAQWLPIETTVVSSHGFQDAVELGLQRFDQARNEEDPLFMTLNLDDLRTAGITPANL